MSQEPRAESVAFCEYPKLIYALPWAAPDKVPDPRVTVQVQTTDNGGQPGEIVEGQPLVALAGEHEVLGWIYLIVLFLVLLTVGVDVERNYAAFWAVALAAVWLLGLWLRDVQGITIFGDIYRFFAKLNVSYDRGLGLALSLILAVPYFSMLLWAQLNNRWRITHNEFEHYSWGRVDDSLARGAKRVRTTYPDVLELLLCGAGTLIVYSATGRSELRRIHNVPLLFLKKRRIDRILEQMLVTTPQQSTTAAAEAEEEDQSSGAGEVGGEKL
jgi:hypothetical protein